MRMAPNVNHIRYIASTDESPTGMVALGYLKALLQIGRVRLITYSGGLHGKWEPFAPLLMTPMPGHNFANVVCCDPSLWTRTHRVAMPVRGTRDLEEATARQELYTAGVRNVLLTRERHDALTTVQQAAARRYDHIVVDTEETLRTWWTPDPAGDLFPILPGQDPALVPIPVRDVRELRGIILP